MKQNSERICFIVLIFFGLFLTIYHTTWADHSASNSYVPNGITPVKAKLNLVEPLKKQYTIINDEKYVVKISFIVKLTEDADYIDLSPNNMPILYRNEHYETILSFTKNIVNFIVLEGDDNLLLEKNELIKIEINLMNIDKNDMSPKLENQIMIYPMVNEEFRITLYPEDSPVFEIC